jgi:hypothetical protein
MKRNTFILFALVAGPVFASILIAQGSPAAQGHGADNTTMMAQHQQMMSEMQAGQKKLENLVASMNAAQGPEKVDRIAAVVTEMVAIHKQMMAQMMPMMSMPGGMMQRGAGQAPGGATGADHEQHHPDNK